MSIFDISKLKRPEIRKEIEIRTRLRDEAALIFYKNAKKADVKAVLQTWDESLHEFQYYNLPESDEAFLEASKFVEELFR